MAVKTIETQVSQCVNTADGAAEIKENLDEILDNLKSIEKSIQNKLFTLLALSILYELCITNLIESFSAFGFSVDNSSVIIRFGPVIISYIYFSTILLFTGRSLLETVYDTSFSQLFPKSYEIDLEMAVRPHQTLKFFLLISQNSDGFRKFLASLTAYTMAAFIAFAPPIYVGFSLYRCSSIYGIDNWISLSTIAACSILCLQALLTSAISNPVISEEKG